VHDVFVLYNHPESPEEFDAHYSRVHVPLVHALPELREFTWGKPSEDDASVYMVARLAYDSAQEAADSLATEAGQRSVEDLANFAGTGVTVLNVSRKA
jgi:uncharacterized protein (TIGR02118 family)